MRPRASRLSCGGVGKPPDFRDSWPSSAGSCPSCPVAFRLLNPARTTQTERSEQGVVVWRRRPKTCSGECKVSFSRCRGLRLTEAQARRLWGLDAASCSALLGALVDAKFLFRTRDGAFMRVEHATPVKSSLALQNRGGVAATAFLLGGIPPAGWIASHAYEPSASRPNHPPLNPGRSTSWSPPAARPPTLKLRSMIEVDC